MPQESTPEAIQEQQSEILIEAESLVVGGTLLVGGIGTSVLQAVFAFKERDYSALEHGILSGSLFIGGAMSAAGVKIIHSGIRRRESEK